MCGQCYCGTAWYGLALFAPDNGSRYPSHSSSGVRNWYNYSIYACAIIPMKSLFFSVGTPECSLIANVTEIQVWTPTASWNLTQNVSSHWWHYNTSTPVPSPQDYPALRMSANGPLTNDTLLIWDTEPGHSAEMWWGALGYWNAATCSPAPPSG